MINLGRCRQLIEGEIEAETVQEDLFVEAYTSAVSGQLLITFLIDCNDIDTLDADSLHFVMLGYGWGQYDLQEEEDQALLGTLSENNNKKFH